VYFKFFKRSNPVCIIYRYLGIDNIINYYLLVKDETDFLSYKFVPSIESDMVSNQFLPAHPEQLVNNTSHVPVIIGLNNMEGMIALNGKYIFNSI